MKTLAILFTLLFVCAASAEVKVYNDGRVEIDGVIVGYSTTPNAIGILELSDNDYITYYHMPVSSPNRCCRCDNYLFKPMKDITAYELSLILELIHGKDIEDLTCEEFRSIKRHLKCND